MLKIGVIGCGYWGPNLVRNFMELEGCRVEAISDLSESRMNSITSKYPGIKAFSNYKKILKNKQINAVVISTNLTTHYKIAKDAIVFGKHILLEKPVTTSVTEAQSLVKIAAKNDCIFMSGHTFLYNSAINETKRYIDHGHIGKILYVHTERTNLGPIRSDTNALWDLAPHDISILLYVLNEIPESVSAYGGAYLKKKREDVVFVTLKFPGGAIGNVHVSWLDPCKVRKFTVIGNKKMLVFDDLNTMEPIRIFDKGAEYTKKYDSYGEFHLVLRDGDILIPKVKLSEPLKNECMAFVEAVRSRKKPLSDGELGLKVVKVLVAAQKSLESNGISVKVNK